MSFLAARHEVSSNVYLWLRSYRTHWFNRLTREWLVFLFNRLVSERLPNSPLRSCWIYLEVRWNSFSESLLQLVRNRKQQNQITNSTNKLLPVLKLSVALTERLNYFLSESPSIFLVCRSFLASRRDRLQNLALFFKHCMCHPTITRFAP